MEVIGIEGVFMMVQNKKSYLRDLATGFSGGESVATGGIGRGLAKA